MPRKSISLSVVIRSSIVDGPSILDYSTWMFAFLVRFERNNRVRRCLAPVVIGLPSQKIYEFDKTEQRSAQKQTGATTERHCD